MKKLALALFAMTSFSVMAQTLEMDINRKIDRLNKLVQRGEVQRLSYSEQMELNQQLGTALRTLRDNDDYRPNPGPIGPRPIPGPGPGRPGRRFETQATAMLVNLSGKGAILNLGGRNPGDILSQCVMQFPSLNLSTVGTIVITANNNAYETLSVFSSSANELCQKIVSKMKPERPDWQFIDVSGTMTDLSQRSAILNLAGDRGEVLEQCLNQSGNARLSTIGQITVSVNRGNLVNRSVFVSNSAAACVEIVKIINQQAP